LLNLGGRVAGSVQSANETAHAGPRNVVDGDVMILEPLQDADMSQPFCAAALERDSDFGTQNRLLSHSASSKDQCIKEEARGPHDISKCEMRAARSFLLILSISFSAEAQEPDRLIIVRAFESYLNMAGHQTAKDFRPLTQQERATLYAASLINPWGFAKAAMSAGIDQWHNKPEEWGQGWGAYGKRVANIEGQYAIQKTVTYLISAPLHEDNRYFGSGKYGFWPRTQYALTSSVLARHDNGRRYLSVSQLSGVAAGAFVARLWLPPSQSTAGDAAASFGITMGFNAGVSVLKEFLPDLVRGIARKRQKP
jgi:hypothetical protein